MHGKSEQRNENLKRHLSSSKLSEDKYDFSSKSDSKDDEQSAQKQNLRNSGARSSRTKQLLIVLRAQNIWGTAINTCWWSALFLTASRKRWTAWHTASLISTFSILTKLLEVSQIGPGAYRYRCSCRFSILSFRILILSFNPHWPFTGMSYLKGLPFGCDTSY